jgi:nucleobase:cation symporter-1, NCS1 family
VPLGTLAFGVLAIRELDQSFADVYSTAVSLQNFGPKLDRRILAAIIGSLTTVLALAFDIGDYQDFLLLLGSVFVPMFAVLVVDFFLFSRGDWDLSPAAASRWLMLVPWMLGFVTYQLINPGTLTLWVRAWSWVQRTIGFTPASWMSASICSFVVAGVATLVLGAAQRGNRRANGEAPLSAP